MILKYLFISLCMQTALSAAIEGYKSYKNYKVYELEGDKYGMIKLVSYLMRNYDVPFHSVKDGKCNIMVAPEATSILENMLKMEGLTSNVLVEDYSEIIKIEKAQTPRKDGFSWTAYYDIDDIYEYLYNMSYKYPNMTEVVVGGRSYEGRQITGLRINSQKSKKKPVMFIESGIHAREWITPATTTYFINELLTSSDPKIRQLRDSFDWHIFPSVNPDGYHYSYTRDRMWRKTRSKTSRFCRGADPNRNWDYNWLEYGATDDPCDYQTYAGSEPFSEVETRTFSEYIMGLDNLLGYIAFHSDAQLLLVPYTDSEEHIQNYDDLVTIGKTSLQYGYAVNQEQYKGPGTGAEILYKASGGSMDWVRYVRSVPLAYTYELRGRNFHWPPERIPEQGEEVTQMMLGLATEAKNLGYH